MRLPTQRWLKVVFCATALIFASVAFYLYCFRFLEWVESDAAVQTVLASKALAAKLPVVGTWYYANGDVWLVASHLLAIVPVAILGLGLPSLLVTVLLGFALELYTFARIYSRLCGELWVGCFAAIVTMIAWSSAHVAFGYIQLAYAFLTMLCMLTFATYASLAVSAQVRPSRWFAAALLLAVIAAQNPTRTLAFGFAPILVGCAWPWRGFSRRRRLAVARVAIGGWALAFAIYAFVFARLVAFSMPRGHLDFVLVGAGGIVDNLRHLARGLTILCGGGTEPSVWSIPGMLVMLGAIVLVCREVLASRALDALRFVAVLVVAQLGIVLVPLLVGNLLVDTPSVRYLMPSLLEMLGLAAMLAVRTLGDARIGWRRFATGWLVAVPIAALVAVPDARPPKPVANVWPDTAELDRVASALVEHKLTHGFSNVLAANFLTMETGGAARTCPVYFRDYIVPQRWLTDTACYRVSTLPDRFFVVTYRDEHDRAALRATLPTEVETLSVGDTYEVHVFRTADTSPDWLDLPLPENDRSAFPLHIAATHLQLRRGNVRVEDHRLVATGESGTVVYGPYITLPRGRYTVTWYGSGIASPGEVRMFVAAEGKDVLADASLEAAKIPAAKGALTRLTFKLEKPRPAIELVVRSQDRAKVALDEVVIERR